MPKKSLHPASVGHNEDDGAGSVFDYYGIKDNNNDYVPINVS